MEIKKVKIGDLFIATGPNYIKEHDEVALNKLRTAIQRHGQPSLVHVYKPTGQDCLFIVAGLEVAKVMRELGLDELYVKEYATPADAALACLELEIKFKTDYFKVAEVVKQLTGAGVPTRRVQHSVPWSETELNSMIKMSDFDWEKFGEPDEVENQISLF